jgi:hypothetical protein
MPTRRPPRSDRWLRDSIDLENSQLSVTERFVAVGSDVRRKLPAAQDSLLWQCALVGDSPSVSLDENVMVREEEMYRPRFRREAIEYCVLRVCTGKAARVALHAWPQLLPSSGRVGRSCPRLQRRPSFLFHIQF